jgi:hypothetical protein
MTAEDVEQDDDDGEQDYYHYVHPEPGLAMPQEMPITSPTTQRPTDYDGVPRSAPAHMQASPWQQHRQQQQPQEQQISVSGDSTPTSKHPHVPPRPSPQHHSTAIPPNTYQQPSRFRERLSKPELQRRHTSIGNEGTGGGGGDGGGTTPSFVEDTARHSHEPKPHDTSSCSSTEAKRVLSGLSLAMMTLEDSKDGTNDTHPSVPQINDDMAATPDSNGKRRAALHQPPPHRRPSIDDISTTPTKTTTTSHFTSPPNYHHQQQQQQRHTLHRDASQEYGYAYNSHIPWQKIHPSHNHPSLQPRGEVEDSPTNRAAMAALGTTPPPMLLNPGSYNTSHMSPSFGKHLLPPRSGSSAVTPPFPNRPSGFAANNNLESTPTTMMLPAPANIGSGGSMSPIQPRLEPEEHVRNGPHPLTSLDLLHQSPFSWNPNTHGSMLSSLTMPDSTMMDLKRSLLLTHQRPSEISGFGGSLGVDWAEEMPFVVEDTTTATAFPMVPEASSSASGAPTQPHDFSSLTASAAVASLAQKCTTSQRLQLFDSRMTTDDKNDGLSQQLAEFRAFANTTSLLMEGKTPSSGSSSAVSNATPTALRT